MRKRARADLLAAAARDLRRAVLEAEAVTPTAARRAAYDGSAPDAALAAYLDTVREKAYRITDAHVDGLRADGLADDAIFELTVAAALGAADRRLAAGLALLGREAAP
ncbi:alkylhydroperoxidase family enzyme [Marmoricola sp. URHA0025 HA25]